MSELEDFAPDTLPPPRIPDGEYVVEFIGHFTATGVRSHFSERFRLWGYDLPPAIFEPYAAE